MADNISENPVHSVERALIILEALAGHPQGYGCTELGQMLRLHKSTVYRIVSTLQAYGFAEKDPQTERYKPGAQLIYLGLKTLKNLDFRKVAIPYMQELVEISRETVQLAVLDRGEVLFVERDHSPEAVTVNLGLRGGIHCTAEGKVLLSSLPQDEVMTLLKSQGMQRYTAKTITDPDQMLTQLEKVRSQGFAVSAEEMVEGVLSIASPVYNHSGNIIASLSITGPSTRLTLERIYRMVNVLKEACASISAQLGYPGDISGKILNK
ncbi:transcriptional regulator [Desulfocucumis palustris]|uniref:Glycerol operon regulatory protein n=1 Tax=Desulfocucumis palustris TaxID=1898651 RepID=A0A2L2X9J5_9FIRM|nr:IclR family transcriptional regulator [Desulfocucumis palustris]GBF32909.1 transcriptional regulator [Desulfocucumis palustris]